MVAGTALRGAETRGETRARHGAKAWRGHCRRTRFQYFLGCYSDGMKACPYCTHVFAIDDAAVCEHCGRNWKTGEVAGLAQSRGLPKGCLAAVAVVAFLFLLIYLLIGLQQVSH